MPLVGHAPAKINLTLEVLNRRGDGFHNLASIFHTLSLCDTIELTPLPNQPDTILLQSEGWQVPNTPDNSVWQAIQRFGQAIRQSGSRAQWVGWQVKLYKRIPTQAGLGGGSSDAGTTLRLLAQWASAQGIPTPELAEIALQIGSDVPFFLLGSNCARAEGRGERLIPLPPLPQLAFVLAKPYDVGVPTGWAYAQLGRTESSPTQSQHTDALAIALQNGTIDDAKTLAPSLHNDFEVALLPQLPALQQVRQVMETAGALRVLLCGSGSVQAGLCETLEQAEAIAHTLRTKGYWAEVATT